MKLIAALLLFISIAALQIGWGALALLVFDRMVAANWLRDRRSRLQALMSPLPFAAVALIGVFLLRAYLYPWTNPQNLNPGSARIYFAPGFFIIREIFCLSCGIFFVWLLRSHRRFPAPLGLIFLFFGATLIATDWLQSLEPHWKSTAFGVIFFTSSLLCGVAAANLFIEPRTPRNIRHDLGAMHFVLICVWTYLVFMAYLIVWHADLPNETAWFAHRRQAAWSGVPTALAVFQFAIPFVILLGRNARASVRVNRMLSLTTLGCQALWLAWLIFPSAFWAGGA